MSLLVFTATVDPTVAPTVARRDPMLRLADYRQSLAVWLAQAERANWDILILENSGWEIGELLQEVSPERLKRLRIDSFSYVEQSDVTRLGKGVAEAKMFDRVSEFLQIPRHGEKYESIIKITGRLTVHKPARLADRAMLSATPWIM